MLMTSFTGNIILLVQENRGISSYHHDTHQSADVSTVFACRVCEKAFPSSGKLRKHENEVHLRRYSHLCPICGKGTSSNSNLRGHMSYCHNMPMDYKCDNCGKTFGYKHVFVRHMAEHNALSTFGHQLLKQFSVVLFYMFRLCFSYDEPSVRIS